MKRLFILITGARDASLYRFGCPTSPGVFPDSEGVCVEAYRQDTRNYWRIQIETVCEEAIAEKGADDFVVVHTGQTGIDMLACDVAERRGWKQDTYGRHWHKFAQTDKPTRNSLMRDRVLALLEEEPESEAVVLAFHPDIRESRVTRSMIHECQNAGFETWVTQFAWS